MDRRSRLRRFALSSLTTVAATAGVWAALGPSFGLAVLVVGYLVTAWLSDDALGNCFVFAVLFLIVIAVVLMGLVGSVMLNA